MARRDHFRGSQNQDTACTSRFEITDVLVHGTEGRTGSDASPLHGAARTGKPLRLHGVARMYGCCLTANRTSILQQNLSHRDPNEPGSARPAVRELHSSTDLHGMPDLDHCTELHGTHAAALQASRGCTSLHGSLLIPEPSQAGGHKCPRARRHWLRWCTGRKYHLAISMVP